MEPHASNDQTFGSRASIERYLAPPDEGIERLVWNDSLGPRDDTKWRSISRIERRDGSIAVREGDGSEFCWSPSATWLSRPAFEPLASVPRPWRKFERLPLSFDLSELMPAVDVSSNLKPLLNTEEFGKNGFVAGNWDGWPILFPALTLLSMMCAPSLPLFSVLMSPVGSGLKLDINASTSDRLVLARTYGFAFIPYRPRAYECLAFWLGNSKRRFALQRTHKSIVQNKPLVLPSVQASVDVLANGYTDGERLVVQRLGADQERRIWPRSWRHLLIRDLDGRDRVACTSRSPEACLSQSIQMFGKYDA